MTRWLGNLFKIDRSLGARGERAAAKYLKKKGYTIHVRNLRNRFGEIDLIAQPPDAKVIVIVEVKATRSDNPPPEVHVNRAKQAKLTALAGQVIRRFRLHNRVVRFDVVGVVRPEEADKPIRITHHPNAFGAVY